MAVITPAANKVSPLPVISFRGMQPTGITISGNGRMFVCFPRWRDGLAYSVAEITGESFHPYPDTQTNEWKNGTPDVPDRFVCIQSVIAHKGMLYVLDTKNPTKKELIGLPMISVYDLTENRLARRYRIESVETASYLNDLRVDDKWSKIYITDSGVGGLLIVDMHTGKNYRLLDRHPFTSAETDHLTIEGERYEIAGRADGIALDRRNDLLYIHALSGHTLYGIPTGQLISRRINEQQIFRMRTPATDGMTMDERGNLYMGDLEKNAVVYLTPDRRELRTLAQGAPIRWPDTFAVYGDYLYFTNSRIPEARNDIRDMEFTVNKIRLPL